ncbi:cysteine--tRNA ligase [Tepidiforma flava]|uniref:Cysteine--tRNA ligase n=1 Tax=Tepidiforma flava TaxID=3004094 RepID=A0ABY7M9G2_9CHLR|nr:cysteine--tRNA ligase [Tepidiforma flava]WBL37186.1 cysteine--tRNA ligase [Tepidiforma flava]
MQLTDTLSTTRKPLLPPVGDDGVVRIYVCGITPYSEAHVGHALHAIAFDTLRRYLDWRGIPVRHIQNFTDIDDKLIERANRLGIPMAELAEQNIRQYLAQLAAMNVLPAHQYPRVTQVMPQIIRFIEGLIAKGFAYAAGGDVYYRVRAFGAERYGALAKRDIDDLRAGARVDPTEHKEDPLDFALWKAAKPGEPSWESPWGPGRPGWHIECSAMALETLGEQIDIHGGGMDLIFPHHTNEIAQTEAYTGKPPFARIWMHNALLQLGSEKMSKSIGNLVSIQEALDRYGADALRLFVITSHYRSPVTYSEDALEAARAGAERLRHAASAPGGSQPAGIDHAAVRARFIEAMDDDLNTPRALAALFDLAREINRAAAAGGDVAPAQAALRELCGVLGLTLEAPAGRSREAAPFIDLLVELRAELRAAKQWALADRIRDRLGELGIELHDSPDGTTWSER